MRFWSSTPHLDATSIKAVIPGIHAILIYLKRLHWLAVRLPVDLPDIPHDARLYPCGIFAQSNLKKPGDKDFLYFLSELVPDVGKLRMDQ